MGDYHFKIHLCKPNTRVRHFCHKNQSIVHGQWCFCVLILSSLVRLIIITKVTIFAKMAKLIETLAVAVAVVVVRALAVDAGYEIVARDSHTRHLQEPAASPQVISFDGDLDQIISLALERAGFFNPDEVSPPPISGSPPPTVTPFPTGSPVHSPNVCEGADMNRLELFNWKYTIETVAHADTGSVIGEVEEILQEKLIPILLSCNNKNATNASIVAIDSTLPQDTVSTDGKILLADSQVCIITLF